MYDATQQAKNKATNWQTREVPAPDGSPEGTAPTFEVFDPETGDVAASTPWRANAGVAVSDLRTFGNINHDLSKPLGGNPAPETDPTHG